MRTFILIVAVGLILSISSCQQWWCCRFPGYVYECFKAGDTVAVGIGGTAGDINRLVNDSLSLYQNNGFTCIDRTDQNYEGSCTLGLKAKNQAVRAGQVCDESGGYCEGQAGYCAQ